MASGTMGSVKTYGALEVVDDFSCQPGCVPIEFGCSCAGPIITNFF
jgi:hypothetical protein